MKLLQIFPAKALNKAYLKQSLKRDQVELFKANLIRMFERIRSDEHEEHLKNIVSDFLKDTWYKQTNEINTSGRTDLVIHNGKNSSDTVGVLIEVKRPGNFEMISPERPNTKALHELLHYYMQERYIKDNKEIRHLIVCNIHEWYIFNAADFERFFFGNQKLVKSYKDWKEGTLPGMGTDWFYQEIAKPFIEQELDELTCVYFNLKDYERIIRNPAKLEDGKLSALYKVLSPPHLLKQTFANDSNSLNKEFYSELLHILGLEEVKDKGKKLIRRKQEGSRNDGSLLENTCNFLKTRGRLSVLSNLQQYGADADEQCFSVALELCITWLNRLLFLKLLEGQLIGYHKGDRGYAFLNGSRIGDFDELNELFFEVLAVRIEERSESVRAKFGNIPYLNSSLFEESDLERATMRINELKNRSDLPLHSSTVLKGTNGKRLSGRKSTLAYLFEFLDAYDFGAEGSSDIQEQNKSIINASVLGLIFEKINGYKDGSFFTPGFITMYICRESIRRAVVRKFNDTYGWSCHTITDLYNSLDKITIKEANDVVNSLKICDPAVGSGHFLVSALNEIIAIKSDLGILADSEGKRLRGYGVTIENDELIVTTDDQIFEYNFKDAESQRVQETFFHEKETIIENCLFGVDINPKSVAICRLRLWIELLKNAYYRRGSDALETLPNIDINIKCGNSLVSRFAISGNPNIPAANRKKLKELTDKYREQVWNYKQSPSNKSVLRKEIENLKHSLENFGLPNDKDLKSLWLKKEELSVMTLFGFSKKETEKRQKLHEQLTALERRFAEKEKLVYHNAFEWRFEFPEVLDDEGEFVGFDAIIGNPPYIRQEAIKEQKPAFMEMFGDFYCGTADIYTYFYKTGLNLLKTGATLCYIAPNKFMRAGYGKNTRELLTVQATPLMVLDFGDLPIFDEATTYPSIVMVQNVGASPCGCPPLGAHGKSGDDSDKGEHKGTPLQKTFFTATFTNSEQLTRFDETLAAIGFTMPVAALRGDGWTLERPEVMALMDRLRTVGKPLGEYVEGKFYRGVLTGLNEAFVIDEEIRTRLIAEDPKSAEIIKPWLRGRDIRKWQAQWANLYVIAIASSGNREWPWSKEEVETTARLIFEQTYPAVHRHLSQWEPGLKKRDDKGRFWWELRACAYWEELEMQKIVYQEIATFQSFCYAEEGLICNNKCFLIPEKNDFFLALLNSKLFWWYLGNLTSGLVGGARAMQMPYMNQLPIPPATDAQQAPIIERVQKILAAPDSPDVPQLEAEIDRLVYALYDLTDEEIAVVEGKP
jgi:type II restriction/modification system DNA methylase subunit YeeA